MARIVSVYSACGKEFVHFGVDQVPFVELDPRHLVHVLPNH